MRAAFTLIELIFVIIVAGILASVAMLKLSAVRTDAEATTTFSNFNNAVRYINEIAYTKGIIPQIDTYVPSGGGLTTTATTIVAEVGGETCANGQIVDTNFNIVFVSTTGNCEIFKGMTDMVYPLSGNSIQR